MPVGFNSSKVQAHHTQCYTIFQTFSRIWDPLFSLTTKYFLPYFSWAVGGEGTWIATRCSQTFPLKIRSHTEGFKKVTVEISMRLYFLWIIYHILLPLKYSVKELATGAVSITMSIAAKIRSIAHHIHSLWLDLVNMLTEPMFDIS